MNTTEQQIRDEYKRARQRGWTKKAKDAMRRKEAEGGAVRVMPNGYTAVNGRPVLDPAKAALIREAFELVGGGRHSVREIARIMAAKGLSGTRGGPLGPTSMLYLFRNPWYAGLVESGEGLARGQHEAVISEETFQRAQAALDRRH
ncbi:hypothetical protein CCAX7_35350 [Capsulimonas corticalis]|uniref:Uncharacterized protein n=1 Tax=Capsulimonas corticalis TaxID=2219043 RepID=A0A402CY49_9BACT|nr:recombinase family protein [Capsulimonas corticalis]BDI31484.1 hypothetical protein CCAX7_35350 [Capsulimonas corticalis]